MMSSAWLPVTRECADWYIGLAMAPRASTICAAGQGRVVGKKRRGARNIEGAGEKPVAGRWWAAQQGKGGTAAGLQGGGATAQQGGVGQLRTSSSSLSVSGLAPEKSGLALGNSAADSCSSSGGRCTGGHTIVGCKLSGALPGAVNARKAVGVIGPRASEAREAGAPQTTSQRVPTADAADADAADARLAGAGRHHAGGLRGGARAATCVGIHRVVGGRQLALVGLVQRVGRLGGVDVLRVVGVVHVGGWVGVGMGRKLCLQPASSVPPCAPSRRARLLLSSFSLTCESRMPSPRNMALENSAGLPAAAPAAPYP